MTRAWASVQWVDSFTPTPDDSWRDISEVVKLIDIGEVVITTVGTIIFEDEDLIALAGSVHDERCCGVMVIPKVCVTGREDWNA